jgi:hypothetical protein
MEALGPAVDQEEPTVDQEESTVKVTSNEWDLTHTASIELRLCPHPLYIPPRISHPSSSSLGIGVRTYYVGDLLTRRRSPD